MSYNKLSKDQVDNIYKMRRRQLGKYFALWSESGHLNKFMITLSPRQNTLALTMELRKQFFAKLNNVKKYKKLEVAYFSAIEFGLNKNPPSPNTINNLVPNFHLHIQLLTNMSYEELDVIVNRIDASLCVHSAISEPQKEGITYQYVVKELQKINWPMQHLVKTKYKGKSLYTSSRKTFATYMITKLWAFMKKTYDDKWKTIQDKYSYILGLKSSGDLIFGNSSNISSLAIDKKKYDEIYIKDKGVYIYVKKNIL